MSAGTNNILFRPIPMPSNGVCLFPLGTLKIYVQTSVHAQEPDPGIWSEQGLRLCSHLVPEHWCLGIGHKIEMCTCREPVPTSVPLGTDTMPEFWLGYLIKGCVQFTSVLSKNHTWHHAREPSVDIAIVFSRLPENPFFLIMYILPNFLSWRF